jgi:hypothetical protein
MKYAALLATLAGAVFAQSQSGQPQDNPKAEQRHGRSAGAEVGSGAGDIGKGAAKGAGNAAKGVGKGAVDLVTLHPVNAAASVGKGAGEAGKDVGVGTVKGAGKIGKGIGKGLKKLF